MRWQKSTTQISPVLINCNGQRNNQNQGGPTQETPGTVLGDSGRNWTKFLLVGRARNIQQDIMKSALHTRSEVKLDTFISFALSCITKGLVLRNTAQTGTARLSTHTVLSVMAAGVSSIQSNCN